MKTILTESEKSGKPTSRRQFVRGLSLLGLGGMLSACMPQASSAKASEDPNIDVAVLNFALNLEYLEAEFYLAAVGRKPKYATNGVGGAGGAVTGIKEVKFSDTDFGRATRDYANEIADDEEKHVLFLREALGEKAVARPAINIGESFRLAADIASGGLIKTFDPYANELFFLHGTFVLEDVGVTAYKGAARLLTNKDYLEAAAGILAVESYHAGEVRTLLYRQKDVVAAAGLKVSQIIQAISDLRNKLGGAGKDQGIVTASGTANVVPVDQNGIAYSRSPREILNIVYGGVDNKSGLFYPQGLNGDIK